MILGPECITTLESIEPFATGPAALQQLAKDKTAFRLKCLNFYTTAAKEIQARLPLRNEFVKQMAFLDPKAVFSESWRSGASGLGGLHVLVSHFQVSTVLNRNIYSYQQASLLTKLVIINSRKSYH